MRISDWSSDVCSSDLPRGRRRTGDAGSRPAGRHHHRPAPERAALHQAAGHHEGQVQAARIDPLRRPGRGFGRHAQDHPLRPAAQAQPRRDGEGRGRTGRRTQAEGVAVMAKVLIVAEHLDGKLNAATAKCVSAAQALSPEAIDIVVLAADPAAVAAEAAQIDGVSKVLTVANEANAHAIAHVLAPQVAKLARSEEHTSDLQTLMSIPYAVF